MRTIKAHCPATAQAIFAYLATRGDSAVSVYKAGAKSLPPYYADSDPRPPRFYCIHAPTRTYNGASV